MGNTPTLNAKVAATGLFAGAVALHGLNQFAPALVPLRLIALGVLIFGAWAFSDEMGLRKPLNRAAFVCFMFGATALAVTVLEPATVQSGKFFLIYGFALLFAMLIWSAAFLHRQRDLKFVGAIGAAASMVPLALLFVGHVSIAAGAFLGVDALLGVSASAGSLQSAPIKIIEAIFIFWAAATAVFLWRGRMSLTT